MWKRDLLAQHDRNKLNQHIHRRKVFTGGLISFWQVQGRRGCSSVLTCTVMAACGAHGMREGFLALTPNSIPAESTADLVGMCKRSFYKWKCVSSFCLCTSEWKKILQQFFIQILSSHPVQEFKFSWVCFFFWLFFCFSSLFLSFSFPSACFSLRCWRFLFLLRSCTIRSCKAS